MHYQFEASHQCQGSKVACALGWVTLAAGKVRLAYSCHKRPAYSTGTASAEPWNVVRNANGHEASQCQQMSLRTCCDHCHWKSLCCKLQGVVSEARKLVSANSQVRGCPAGKIHRKQYPVKVKPSGKTCQLSCLKSTLLRGAARRKQWLFTQGEAKACCLDKLASDRV